MHMTFGRGGDTVPIQDLGCPINMRVRDGMGAIMEGTDAVKAQAGRVMYALGGPPT